MIESDKIINSLDNWIAGWNNSGPDRSREHLLEFLKDWRRRGGDWFEQTAKEFFSLAGGLICDGWAENFLGELQKLHFANHTIWHFEDEARRGDVASDWIVEIKRGIDAVNQQRNNQMENIDEWILTACGVDPEDEAARLHSEPPGLMLDRLSILSLKIYHYRLKQKIDVLKLLDAQRLDLAGAFDRAVEEFSSGKSRFRIYRQFKTYNDPDTNPLLKGKT